MPAEQGNDAERFAAAVEQGRSPGEADAELLRDLEIVAMLRSRGEAFAPQPDAKARAKQRLMAALAAEQNGPGPRNGPPASPQRATAERMTQYGHVLTPAFPTADRTEADPAGETTRIERVELPRTDVPRAGTAHADIDATAVTTQFAAVPAAPADATSAIDATSSTDATSVTGTSADGSSDAHAGGTTVLTRSGRRGRHTMPTRPAARARGSQRPASHGLRRRAAIVGSAALVMLLALTGTGVFASRDALPGDNLYAMKRAAESAGLALTFDSAAKARRHLELATTRLDEIEKMVARQQATTAAPPAAEPELLQTTIRDFDTATGEGSRILLAGQQDAGTTALSDLRSWATEQVTRLSALRPALPMPAGAGADDSIQLLDRIVGRTEALEQRSSCTEVTSGAVDDLGPLPAEGACAPRPNRAGQGGTESSSSRVANEDPATTEPSTTSDGSTPDPTTTTEQQGSETTSPDGTESPGLLPQLGENLPDPLNLPDRLGADTPTNDSPSSRSSRSSGTSDPAPPPSDDSGNLSVPLPLPLLPPIVLPPLLPGLPGITIG